jgi:hypothetical protein
MAARKLIGWPRGGANRATGNRADAAERAARAPRAAPACGRRAALDPGPFFILLCVATRLFNI